MLACPGHPVQSGACFCLSSELLPEKSHFSKVTFLRVCEQTKAEKGHFLKVTFLRQSVSIIRDAMVLYVRQQMGPLESAGVGSTQPTGLPGVSSRVFWTSVSMLVAVR